MAWKCANKLVIAWPGAVKVIVSDSPGPSSLGQQALRPCRQGEIAALAPNPMILCPNLRELIPFKITRL